MALGGGGVTFSSGVDTGKLPVYSVNFPLMPLQVTLLKPCGVCAPQRGSRRGFVEKKKEGMREGKRGEND